MTIPEAVLELHYGDHAIFDDKTTQAIYNAFGIKDIKTSRMRDTRSEFKGATIPWSDGEGTYALAEDASVIAMRICDRLNIEYRDYFGRGSQLRECAAKLRDWAEANDPVTQQLLKESK